MYSRTLNYKLKIDCMIKNVIKKKVNKAKVLTTKTIFVHVHSLRLQKDNE